MKILLVNNHTLHLDALKASLTGHELEVMTYRPGAQFNEEGKDLIILSGGGGEGLEIDDQHANGHLWYEDEMHFVLRTKKPVVGICMGFEVIAKAYGSDVKHMGYMQRGLTKLRTTGKGRRQLSLSAIKQAEFHQWHVPAISGKHFDILAESDSGLEIIRHKRRPLIATQFHPEKGGSLSLDRISELALEVA